jgi:phosphomannomutase
MALRFGTSGVRGLVTEMTERECYLYTTAFVQHLKEKATPLSVALAGDYRGSTPRILKTVVFAVHEEGLEVDFCGNIATPALMSYGVRNNMASIMVTGSHIPEDRNGIKFNMPWGEVLKEEEGEISRRYAILKGEEEKKAEAGTSVFAGDGAFKPETAGDIGEANRAGRDAYVERFMEFFPARCLEGLKIVFYQHSSVSRDVLPEILKQLGAEVIGVGRSETFVAVDTEAVEEPERLAAWVHEYTADALVSTDGDGDRALVVDEKGKVLRGDILGILVADFLGADSVSAPVSCNTALERSGRFGKVSRTRIGSPYVIASMREALEAGYKTVVGYEANGGFLTASDIENPETGAILKRLPTRDAALPIITVLLASLKRSNKLSGLVRELPPRFTASGLLKDFPNEQGRVLVARFQERGNAFANEIFSSCFGHVDSMDFTDGARMIFTSGDIVHLRPSGNAPEFRCYTESATEEQALRNNGIALQIVEELKGELESL